MNSVVNKFVCANLECKNQFNQSVWSQHDMDYVIFVSVATGVEGSGQVRVYLVKKAERGEVYKKKMSWMLRELKQVDGKDKMKV